MLDARKAMARVRYRDEERALVEVGVESCHDLPTTRLACPRRPL